MAHKPPKALREMDKQSVEAVELALYFTLTCMCAKCGRLDEPLPHWSEPPWNGDDKGWAKEWAPKVRAKGWSMADDCFNLLCFNCRPDFGDNTRI